jgi:hypothetical protein
MDLFFSDSPEDIFDFSTVAFRRIGLLLILVRWLMRASDSAVVPPMTSSNFSADNIFENMESWISVGVMKTTYSAKMVSVAQEEFVGK